MTGSPLPPLREGDKLPPTGALAQSEPQPAVGDLLVALELELGRLGWATCTRATIPYRWEVSHPALLPGLHEAARRSLQLQHGWEGDQCEAYLQKWSASSDPMHVYLACLSHGALTGLLQNFGKREA